MQLNLSESFFSHQREEETRPPQPAYGLAPSPWLAGALSVSGLLYPGPARTQAELRIESKVSEPREMFIPRARVREGRQLSLTPGLLPEQLWLQNHENEYRGSWVALNGPRLIAHGTDGREVFREAKAAGVLSPFLVFIEKDPLPSGGW